jgi:hypothetical protein
LGDLSFLARTKFPFTVRHGDMNTRWLKNLLLAALALGAAFQIGAAQRSAAPGPVRITGHYRFKSPSAEKSLDAQQLPGGRVKIYLYASWIGDAATGNVNNGEVKATLPLRNNLAVYESGQCRITIRFTGKRALVTQSENDCGFGLNVSAEGNYLRRSALRPRFDF